MDNTQDYLSKTLLNIHQAAQVLAPEAEQVHDMEVRLAHAIEQGELHADIKRWATEQWEGKQLPGNIDRLQTFVARSDLASWLRLKALANPFAEA